MSLTMMTISTFFLIIFALLSMLDGIYYHLWKFKLQEREDSKFEHLMHTGRALLFIPTLFLIYIHGVQGILFWVAVFVLVLDLILEILDVLNENKSRKTIGGLSSEEYLLHTFLIIFRVAAITMAFTATSFEGSHFQIVVPELTKMVAYNLLPGAILVAVLHIYLIFDPYFISRIEKMVCRLICKKTSIIE